jgi:putative peptidoglycan lipid II flippase
MTRPWYHTLLGPAALIAFIAVLSKALQAAAGIFFAHRFGADMTTDAYLLAKSLPIGVYLILDNLLYNALTPLYRRDTEQQYRRFFSALLFIALAGAALAAAAIFFAAPFLFRIMAPGADVETQLLAARLCRVMAAAVLMLAPATALKAWNACRGRYILAALDALIMSSCMLLALAAGPDRWGVWPVAAALPAASGILLILQAAAGVLDPPLAVPRCAGPYMREFLRLVTPLLAFNALHQVNVLGMNAFLTLSGEGAVSWMNFSYNAAQIPVSVLDLVVLSTFFPWSTALSAHGGRETFARAFRDVIRLLFAVLLPAGVWMALMRRDVIAVVFEHGNFGPDAAAGAADCLRWLAIAMTPWAIDTFAYRCLFALRLHGRYAVIMAGRVALNLLLCALLAPVLAHHGVALAFAAAWIAGAAASTGAVMHALDIQERGALLRHWFAAPLIVLPPLLIAWYMTVPRAPADPFFRVLITGSVCGFVTLFIYGMMFAWKRKTTTAAKKKL